MKRKILPVLAVCAALLGIQSVQAHFCWKDFYVGTSGSIDWARHNRLSIPASIADPAYNFTVKHKTGGNVAGFIGYEWNDWNFEVEGAFRHCPIDDVVFKSTGSADQTLGVGSHRRIWSVMFNTRYDAAINDCFSAYFGAGVGVGFHTLKLDALTFGVGNPVVTTMLSGIDERDTLLAWQAMTGLNYHATDHISLFLGYHFFATSKPRGYATTQTVGLLASQKKYSVAKHPVVHSLEAGVRFHL